METLDELQATERAQRRHLEKLIENGKKTALPKRTKGWHETKITDLKRLWLEYEAVDNALFKALPDEKGQKEKTESEDHYSELERKYSEYMGELLEGLSKLSNTTEQTSEQNHTVQFTQEEPQLPRITVPKFDGNYDNWRSFHDLYVSLIHNNTRIRPVQKLHYLKSSLEGDAEAFLRHVPITNEDYMPAWQKLIERFENKRVLVNHQLKRLFNQPKLNTETGVGLKTLLNTTEEVLQQFKGMKIDTSSWDILLIHILVQRLPFLTLKLWEEEQGATQELPKYIDFKAFLSKRVKILESISDTLTSKTTQATRLHTKAFNTITANNCPACNGSHFVQACKQFKQMDVRARRKAITTANRCFNCLSNRHTVRNCTSQHRCQKCQDKHHTMLHEDIWMNHTTANKTGSSSTQDPVSRHSPQATFTNTENTSSKSNKADDIETNTTQNFISRDRSHALLATAIVRAQGDYGQPQLLRCLVDTGSEYSFITQAAFNKLQTTCFPTQVKVTGLNTSTTGVSTKQTKLKLLARNTNSKVIIEDFLVIKGITNNLPSKTITKQSFAHLKNLQLADPGYWKPGGIDALLGSKVFAQIVQEGVRRGSNSAPVAVKTLFGWILLGVTNQPQEIATKNFLTGVTNWELDKQLTKFWETEELPSKQILTPEEKLCQHIFETTNKRLANGRYQVLLPFTNQTTPVLGESRPQAIKRYWALQSKFARNTDLEREYSQCLDEYLKLGHMIPVDPPKSNQPHYYIPHHAVFKESTTTKLRVVFDASAKTTNGYSLNNFLLKGPTIQPQLSAILLNWRKHRVAMHADIEKMYRMIEVHPDHHTFQRIIWKNPRTKQLQDYQLTTVTFGTAAAPYLAIRTLQQLASDERKNWPLAARTIQSNFYVDDVLTGADTIEEARALQAELINMLQTGGFNLRKWSSNKLSVISDLPTEHRAVKGTLSIAEDELIKTLGIRWHPSLDHFTFTITLKHQPNNITKRNILAEVASLYDPLGWLSPIIITAKLLIQDLWITGCSWDQPVSSAMERQWTKYKEELKNLESLTIPRWIHYTSGANLQLHGFCDASSRAYAAVLYLRVQYSNDNIEVSLLTSKTKVAPIKPITIPRLELNGAVLLARLVKATVETMQFEEVPVVAWTDSTIVLQWIKEHPSRWQTYVANRVVEIQESIRYDLWRHIPTAYNPADLACRGTLASNLKGKDLWWHGPSWLSKSEGEWPKFKVAESQTSLEAKKLKTTNLLITTDNNLLDKYSSFTRLQRIIATMQRFIFNLKNPQQRHSKPLTCSELQQAEIIILRLVQKTTFPEEYNNLKHNKAISNHSRLITLNPFMDHDGLIRVGGRLANAYISYERKHPVILPQDHHVTRLIIHKIHIETLHGGPSLVLNTSRHKYWIINGRRCITSSIRNCVTCVRHRKTTQSQLMGQLPTYRVNVAKPFNKVGVDYAGPILLRTAKHRNAKVVKAYICVFVCMVTKAIHIELVSDLTSEAFIASLKRFISRRGLCTDIYSDCGTNFTGAKAILDKELHQAIHNANSDIATYLSSKTVNWHFNPPASPHFGGLWEAGVKSIKYHLKRTLQHSACTFEEYATVLTQVEACLNSRPLCYTHADPNEPLVLTPGHFLIGQPLNALPDIEDSTKSVSASIRWKHLQHQVKSFWTHWSKDYLNHLQQRSKWFKSQRNIDIGDVVLIRAENTPPTYWPLGVIDNVYPGKDGLVRVVQIRTKNGTLQRPVTKVCLLPINDTNKH